MRWNRFRDAGERATQAIAGVRGWLRRWMPRAALAAVALFILWLFVRNFSVYRNTFAGRLLGSLAFFAVFTTIVYYGLKGLLRLKRMLLWRVRRRLVITYLFVGLTPIVLLLLLGLFAAIGGSSQAMVRIVTVQLNATQKQAHESARTLTDALSRLPANTNDRAVRAWVDERAALLQSSLPGARVAVWRGSEGANSARLGLDAPAQFTSEPPGEDTRGVGLDTTEAGAALPAWLQEQEEWSGLAFMPPPEDSKSAFGSPSVRALVRGSMNGRPVVLLLTVPVSRALIRQYRENTGVNVRPFFLGANANSVSQRSSGVEIRLDDENSVPFEQPENADANAVQKPRREIDFRFDQFGDALPDTPFVNFWYPIILPATDWSKGEQSAQWAFMVDWSWGEGGKQFWGDAMMGQYWWQALAGAGIAFLILELLALFSAAWMTRAITGTVHKLYRATGFIKRGDFSHRISTRSRDQLGELALAFNDMSANIETLLTERVEREWLEREVEIAAEVQAQLFPRRLPALSTAEITGECRAARGVAGDYYDYIEVAPGLVAFALGDVSGKGISASLVMSNLQASLRAQATIIAERLKGAAQMVAAATTAAGQLSAATTAAGDGQIIEPPCGVTGVDTSCAVSNMAASINWQLCNSTDANRFATLFLALYDERTRFLRYTNAGHNAALLVREDGSIERLTRGGIMVGAFDWAQFEEAQTIFEAGDLLLIFSDGLSEAQNASGEEYGEERLARFAVTHRGKSADEIRRGLFDEVDKWSGAVERGDDQTLVILKGAAGGEDEAVNSKS